MRVIGLAGWSGAGKTTLLTRLIPEIGRRGLSVSTLKHAHHAFDLDTPGKDSYAHREAGAREVLISSERRWALMHELRDESEASLYALLGKLSPVDLVIIEGFKREPHAKIEVFRDANGKPALHPQDAQHHRHRQRPCLPRGRASGREPGRYCHHRRFGLVGSRAAGDSAGAATADRLKIMAQLSLDEAAFGALMSVEQAAERAFALVVPVPEVQTLTLQEADGRVIAGSVSAAIDLPPFANSAVDGYAVRCADLAPAGETRLPLLGRVPAGADATLSPANGVAVRVFTGAPMPPGADTVFMQEDVALEEGHVVLPHGLACGANARPAGEDIARGTQAIASGQRLRPQDLALLAALGETEVVVRRRPRIAIFSTGNELTEPGLQPRPGRDLRRQPHAAARHGDPRRRGGRRSRHPARRPRQPR